MHERIYILVTKKSKDLPRYEQIVGQVGIATNYGYPQFPVSIKGIKNEFSKVGLFYVNQDDFVVITKEEYESFTPKLKVIYVVAVTHKEQTNERVYYFKSPEELNAGDDVIVKTKYGNTQATVVNCQPIYEDEEAEFCETHGLTSLAKVVAKQNVVTRVVTEVKNVPLKW